LSAADRPDGHHWATVRAANLIWMLGRPEEAQTILEGLSAEPESAAGRAERIAVEACVDAVMARCELALEKARAAMKSAALPDFHAMMASVALIMAQGALDESTTSPKWPTRPPPCDHVISGVAHAVLVRIRVRAGVPVDGPHR